MEFTLATLANMLNGEICGDGECMISHVDTLQRAQLGALSFYTNSKYKNQLLNTRASAVLIDKENASLCPVIALIVEDPSLGFAKVARVFNPIKVPESGIHPSAVIDSEAKLGRNVSVGAKAVVGRGAYIHSGAIIGPGCVVEEGAIVGSDSHLIANVFVAGCATLGQRVILHPGVVIGSDGFGITKEAGVWLKVPQLGGVTLKDDVEVGSNSTIDRGKLENTVLEIGVKIDNLVHIGHNVRVGAHTAIAGCVAIAGSVTIGERCVINGAVSIAGHLELADDVHLTGGTEVAKSIKQSGVYSSGMPAQDNMSWRRMIARMQRLDDTVRRVKRLEKKHEEPTDEI